MGSAVAMMIVLDSRHAISNLAAVYWRTWEPVLQDEVGRMRNCETSTR